MELIITNNYEEMSKRAAAMVFSQVILNRHSVLGLPTGSTPLGLYKYLIEAHKKGYMDFSNIKTFNLDEYYRLDRNDPQSYYYFMMENLINHINIDTKNVDIPNCMLKDIEKECEDYEERIKAAGGIDLQIIGIGNNGHIGFNEPGPVFSKKTHLVNLSQSTIEANARFFKSIEDVPTKAVTMGIQTIMQSKRLLLIASGLGKADAIYKTIKGEIDPMVPASIIQLHRNATVIIDKDAASKL
ncbi:MAG TPA: glucosamine-6-phosphate deaminase [Eubacteriaceae bacterium]|jgi:glucosamine-6-phosphate deaminase|nr:glucosamine-6-phosphate deaminase [Eubacteriaceae bacterium]